MILGPKSQDGSASTDCEHIMMIGGGHSGAPRASG